ncbi:ORF6N domain-containing protein [Salmonella enterica subsp. enterica serovar Oranienburg]|nr:ORF6N domain-containing protein [Salmonella enterica subsp. enterica serovar Oranienburg]EKS2202440.1 ORF6N domain-containing protein [Salmonella enterica]
MTTQISVENLSPITHNQIPVITTELLARLYGCSVECIHRNHHRNKDRFAEGKHYIIAKGADLQNLKISLRDFQSIAPNVRKLILWTERGAARHAKMLETDQAWEVFEKLEDCYFSQKRPPAMANVGLSEDREYLLSVRSGRLEMRPLAPDEMIVSTDFLVEGLRRRGWLVVRRESLVEKLMQF